MAQNTKINQLSEELAGRARKAFTGVVGDLDQLLSSVTSKLDSGAEVQKKELLKIIARLRKSLDARLSSLEKAVKGSPKPSATKAVKAAKKVSKRVAGKTAKTAKTAKKTVKKTAKKAGKSTKKSAKAVEKTVRKTSKAVKKAGKKTGTRVRKARGE